MLSPALLASLAELVRLTATLEVVISITALTVVLSLGFHGKKKPHVGELQFSKTTQTARLRSSVAHRGPLTSAGRLGSCRIWIRTR